MTDVQVKPLQIGAINKCVSRYADASPGISLAEAALLMVMDDFKLSIGTMYSGVPVDELRMIVSTTIQAIRVHPALEPQTDAIAKAVAAETERCAGIAKVAWISNMAEVDECGIGNADREALICELAAAAIRTGAPKGDV